MAMDTRNRPMATAGNIQAGSCFSVKQGCIVSTFFWGQADTQLKQPVHSGDQTFVLVCTGMLAGQIWLHISQIMQPSTLR
jgi:hypothetical protein